MVHSHGFGHSVVKFVSLRWCSMCVDQGHTSGGGLRRLWATPGSCAH